MSYSTTTRHPQSARTVTCKSALGGKMPRPARAPSNSGTDWPGTSSSCAVASRHTASVFSSLRANLRPGQCVTPPPKGRTPRRCSAKQSQPHKEANTMHTAAPTWAGARRPSCAASCPARPASPPPRAPLVPSPPRALRPASARGQTSVGRGTENRPCAREAGRGPLCRPSGTCISCLHRDVTGRLGCG
jgi:hypothetical protein